MSHLRDQILDLAKKNHADITAIRRDIHRHPEIGFDVHRTAGIAAQSCRELGLKVQEKVGKTGVMADLIVNDSYPLIALRADMDALPMQEKRESPYKSTIDGAAHMCGHDAHTAMLIGGARILTQLKDQLKCNVRFVFQPNEENLPGGAPAMIEDGVLNGVEMMFGLHVWPELNSGEFGICHGPAMGQPDEFKLYIDGVGGHAAEPHLAIDPIVIGSHIVTQLQSLVSRRVDASELAVISITEFHAGSTHNVIPDSAFLHGTLRTFNPEVQKFLYKEIIKQSEAITKSMGAKLRVEWTHGYPVTFNHQKAVAKSEEAAQAIFEAGNIISPAKPTLGGEDFGYYSQQIPACFAFLGMRNDEKDICYMCHDPRFDIDEDRLVEGMAYHASVALHYKK